MKRLTSQRKSRRGQSFLKGSRGARLAKTRRELACFSMPGTIPLAAWCPETWYISVSSLAHTDPNRGKNVAGPKPCLQPHPGVCPRVKASSVHAVLTPVKLAGTCQAGECTANTSPLSVCHRYAGLPRISLPKHGWLRGSETTHSDSAATPAAPRVLVW